MNIAQAKQIPLQHVLDALGYTPAIVQDHELWYRSPFRDEVEPSFKVNRAMNAWYDHGQGKGGTVIELIQQLFRLPDVAQTLRKIRSLPISSASTPAPVPPAPASPSSSSSGIEVEQVSPVRSRLLLAYLTKRGIDPTLAETYVRQVDYRAKGRRYTALGFANDVDGFELRNPYFKGSTSKSLSTIQGDPGRVCVFEGFFDFLTAVTRHGGPLPSTVIVLNSVALKDAAVESIMAMAPDSVDLYRDNDAAGQALLAHFRQQLTGISVIDHAQLYQGCNDLNAWHVKTRQQR